MLNEWERAEVERSAFEASHADKSNLLADEKDLIRYLNPSADTPYPLEYSFHLLGDVRGRTVLEYGCGDGINTLALARRGARVIALDISPDLIRIAQQRLAANGITSDVKFIVGSAHDMPIPADSVDVVFGIAILHHLELALASREVRRVLRKGGRAIFQEPVRNSRVVKMVRGLIPYRSADVSPFERPLTDRELEGFGEGYSSYRSKPFLLPSTSLIRLLPFFKRATRSSYRWDSAVLRRFPALGFYATVRVVEITK